MRANILMLSVAAMLGLLAATPVAQAQVIRYRPPSYQWTPYGYSYQSPQTFLYSRGVATVSPSYGTYSTVNYYPAVSAWGIPYYQPVYSTGSYYTPPAIRVSGLPYTLSPYMPAASQFYYLP